MEKKAVGEFRILKDKCFKKTVQGYAYEMCQECHRTTPGWPGMTRCGLQYSRMRVMGRRPQVSSRPSLSGSAVELSARSLSGV